MGYTVLRAPVMVWWNLLCGGAAGGSAPDGKPYAQERSPNTVRRKPHAGWKISAINYGKHLVSLELMCHGEKFLSHRSLCFGTHSLKIKLWATAESVGVWMTHNHRAIHVIAFMQSHNKKYTPDRDREASQTSPKSSPKIVYWEDEKRCSLKTSPDRFVQQPRTEHVFCYFSLMKRANKCMVVDVTNKDLICPSYMRYNYMMAHSCGL